jgi:hypothetical protein
MRELMHVLAGEQRRKLVALLAAGKAFKASHCHYVGGRSRLGSKAEGKSLVADHKRRWQGGPANLQAVGTRTGGRRTEVAHEPDEHRALGRR